ncbi:MAG: RDD family protein [Treponema sp.]|nr:RDD family protein [Treponema sp.]
MELKRIIAFGIDLAITCFIQLTLMIIFVFRPLLFPGLDEPEINIIMRQLILTYCSCSFLVIRDIIGKRSIGKIIMKLKIVNKSDGKDSNTLKRFIRNISWYLGIIDIIFYSIAKERIGEKIAGTKVAEE